MNMGKGLGYTIYNIRGGQTFWHGGHIDLKFGSTRYNTYKMPLLMPLYISNIS